MCGIAGWISNKPLDNSIAERLSAALIHYCRERGQLSAGAWTNTGGLLKAAIDPDDFIDRADFGPLFNGATMALLHTRMPTCSSVTDEQAQPFQVGSIISVHNGFYHNMKEVASQWQIKKPSGVDSELIPAFVAEYGIRALPKFIKSTSGPSAIGLVEGAHMYLLRAGNPIAFAHLELGDGVSIGVFASTEEILKLSLASVWLLPEGLKIKTLHDDKLFEITPVGVKKLARIKRDSLSAWGDEFREDYKKFWRERGEDSDYYDYSLDKNDEPKDVYDMVLDEWEKD